MPHWIEQLLEKGGLWGAISAVLIGVVALLWRELKAANRENLDGRATLARIIEANTQASESFNDLVRELSNGIHKQAEAFARLAERTDMQHDNLKDRIADMRIVIDSLSTSHRALAQTVESLKQARG